MAANCPCGLAHPDNRAGSLFVPTKAGYLWLARKRAEEKRKGKA